MSTELVEIVVDGQEAQCLLQSASKSSAAWAILRVSIMKCRLSGVSAPEWLFNVAQTPHAICFVAELHCQTAAQKIEQMLASSHSPLTFRDTIRTFAETEVQARLGR